MKIVVIYILQKFVMEVTPCITAIGFLQAYQENGREFQCMVGVESGNGKMIRILMGIGSCSMFLLIKRKTGIIYEHQFNGNDCCLIEQEGFLIPLLFKEKEDKIIRNINDILYGIICERNTINDIDDLLKNTITDCGQLRLDYSRKEECCEAYIPVKFDTLMEFNHVTLIYENSD